MRRIAVIAGAGPAGLTAAYELLERTDIQPIVCESTTAIGGIAQTFNYRGNRIDIGGHRFFSKSLRVMDWWLSILPLADDSISPDQQPETVMLKRNRLSRIFFRRSFFPYPLGITLKIAQQLGWGNTVLIGLSYLKAKLLPQRNEKFLDAFLINRFGKRLYETFFRDYTEKVWGVPCNQIPSDWGAQRIKGLSLTRAFSHALRDLLNPEFRKSQQDRETSLITQFYYPKFGPGQLWEEVTKKVQAKGGVVKMQTRVRGVHLDQGKVTRVTLEDVTTGETEECACDYFFSTMPLKHLLPMISPQPPAAALAVADGLQYRDFLTVGLLLRSLHVKERTAEAVKTIPDNWIYIQEGDVRVGRVQIFNNWSPYLVKDPANTVWIGLEYFVNEGGDLWIKEDQELIQLGISELVKISFIRTEDVLDACVLRMPKAYPAYFGSYNQLGLVRSYIDEIPNLFAIGRNGMHRYNNQDHSMLTAMKAVDAIVSGSASKAELWAINAEEEYHETGKSV